MSIKCAVELRLKDYLQLPEAELVNIPSRFPIDQIVEACADGAPDKLQQFHCLIQHNAYGHDSLDVLALRGNGLFFVDGLKSTSLAHWPNALQTWLRLVTVARQREQSARQDVADLLAREKEGKRLALLKEAEKQAMQIEAERDQRRVDDWSKWQSAVDQAENDRQAKSQDELAVRIAKQLIDQGSIPLQTKKPADAQKVSTAEDVYREAEAEADPDRVFSHRALKEAHEFFNPRGTEKPPSFDVEWKKLHENGFLSKNGKKGYKASEVRAAIERSDHPYIKFRLKQATVVAGGLLVWGGSSPRA